MNLVVIKRVILTRITATMIRVLLLALLCTPGCVRQTVKFSAPPPPLSEDRVEYEQGLRAFREFTPEAYLRAIGHFRKALELAPGTCEYAVQLSQTSLFLAQEQRSNYEDFNVALEAGAAPMCAAGTAAFLRLEALVADFAPRRDRTPLTKVGEAVALDPNDGFNWLVTWKLNPTTRDNALLKALELEPNLAAIHYEIGSYKLLTGEYLAARGSFERARELSPKHFRSVIGLAQAISALDDEADIEPLYKEAVELAPTFIEGRVLLGDYYAGLEEIELARDQYLEVIRLNPKFEIAQLRLGVTYLQVSNWDAAELAFRTAIQINPSSYEAFYYIGNIWVARGQLANARESYEQSLSFVLNFPDASYALGTVHFRERRIDQALEQFEKVLRTNRRHADAYFSRAAVWTERSLYEQAIKDYNQALELYEEQLRDIGESITEYEDRGLMKKAEAEKRRKDRLEAIIARAKQFKIQAEGAWSSAR